MAVVDAAREPKGDDGACAAEAADADDAGARALCAPTPKAKSTNVSVVAAAEWVE